MSTELPVRIRVEIINEKIAELKEEFAKFIVDKDYSLEERWSVFAKANDALSNHNSWTEHFKHPAAEISGDSYGRGECIDVVDWVDENLVEVLAGSFDEPSDKDFENASKDLDSLREEILEKNIKSFCFDW
jgi:uncharacterized protein YhaN